MTRRTLPRRILLAAPVVLLALFMLGAGVPKLIGIDTPNGGGHADFARWGYPEWFRHAVGAVETLAALLLVLPKPRLAGAAPRFWGAALLVADMTGALATHLVHGEAAMMAVPAALLVLAAGVALWSRPAWLRRGAPDAAAQGAV